MTPEVCPNCGAEVPRNAKACPECGSDDQTGWSEAADASGLDLPDDEFDYAKYVEKEFGDNKPVPHGIAWWWWVAGILTVGAFVWLLVAR